jgi:ABC-type sugar transport system ATPase subunit
VQSRLTGPPEKEGAADVPLVQVSGLSRSFGGVPAVSDVSFTLRPGEIHALVGHNGAGKSTVVKMLSGQLDPDAGQIAIEGRPVELRSRQVAQRLGVALVDQELSVVPSLTVAENMLLGDIDSPWVNRRGAAARRCREVLDDIGLNRVRPHQLVSSLSIGERQLVEIAKALSQRARVVILDEPTATLTDHETKAVFAAVRRVAARGCAVVFVSHRLGEVLELSDRVTVLRDGRLVATTPSRDLTVDALIVQMLGEAPRRVRAEARTAHEPAQVLRIDRLSVPGRLEDFSLTAHAGRIYALAGQVGSGAADVLRALAGLHAGARGTVGLRGTDVRLGDPLAAARSGVAFVSNDRKSEGLFLDASVARNLTATRLPRLARRGIVQRRREREARSAVAELAGLPANRLAHPVLALSGGNQQKVFVGRCLGRTDVHVLLLDEPTRGVDVGGRAAIHRLLRDAADAGMVVLFASTELEELLDLGDVIVTMRAGRVVDRYEGGADAAALLRDMTKGGDAA